MSPTVGAVLDNSCGDGRDPIQWAFSWSGCRDATRYHLNVIGPQATVATIDIDSLIEPAYTRTSTGSYISPGVDVNWRWQVRAFRQGSWTEFSAPRLFDVEPVNSDCAPLSAPVQLTPTNGTVFTTLPRSLTLTWEGVANAVSYNFDLEFCQTSGCAVSTPYPARAATTSTSFFLQTFVGAQPGRWRVWAINSAGVAGAKSAWWEFRFTQ